ncbi:MAG TPA: putative sugar nucleotidyl transferase [Gemmatimonadales bacterium]|nr:putative sugar nucleotidyl transferase [Gemmatimonadales bacterium]
MTRLILHEPDSLGPAWQPFAGVRPVAELRAGLWKVRERWEHCFGLRTEVIAGAHCAGFIDVDAPPVVLPADITGPAVVAMSDFAPDLSKLELGDWRALVHDGHTVAIRLEEGEAIRWPGAVAHGAAEIEGFPLRGTWTLLDALEHFLASDCAARAAELGGNSPDGAIMIGTGHGLGVGRDARIESGVVFDLRKGAVAIEQDAEVCSGTRIEGPCWIGSGARVLGGMVRGTVVGPMCVVRGEVSASIFLGYANKAHDGFVGHSVLGHWTNLGALTTTSNLKNTYGRVRLEPAGEQVSTGRQFVGTLMGDHAKTAIGTMLGTGTVVGAGANVFGDGRPPRWVAPFAWGQSGSESMNQDGFLSIAGRVMPRRNVELTPEHDAWLRSLWQRLAGS